MVEGIIMSGVITFFGTFLFNTLFDALYNDQ